MDSDGRPLRGHAGRDLAGQRSGPLPPPPRQLADAPLDPNFSGAGRCLTDERGRFRFVTVKPGAYPWGNHYNAWRPAHIHFSLLGRAFTQRLVTQMYFPNDPLFEYDPIFRSVRDPAARERMIAASRSPTRASELGAGLRVGHRAARAGRHPLRGRAVIFGPTPSQTVGPFFSIGLPWPDGPDAVAPDAPARPPSRSRARVRRRRRAGPGQPHRDLAGRPRGSVRRSARLRRRTLRAAGLPRLCPLGSEIGDGTWAIRTLKPGPLPGTRRWAPGAAHRRVGVRPRAAAPLRHAHLLRRRGRGQRAGRGAPVGPTRAARRRCWRSRSTVGIASTSTCRVPRETVFFAL